MATFIHVDQPRFHAGVERLASAIAYLSTAMGQIRVTRALAALLLGAVVSGLVVVADRIVVSFGGGNWLLAWALPWMLTFIALALLSGSSRSLALHVTAAWRRIVRRQATNPVGHPSTSSLRPCFDSSSAARSSSFGWEQEAKPSFQGGPMPYLNDSGLAQRLRPQAPNANDDVTQGVTDNENASTNLCEWDQWRPIRDIDDSCT
jgi:hypothetical protein